MDLAVWSTLSPAQQTEAMRLGYTLVGGPSTYDPMEQQLAWWSANWGGVLAPLRAIASGSPFPNTTLWNALQDFLGTGQSVTPAPPTSYTAPVQELIAAGFGDLATNLRPGEAPTMAQAQAFIQANPTPGTGLQGWDGLLLLGGAVALLGRRRRR